MTSINGMKATPTLQPFEQDFNRGELYVLYAQNTLVGCITISSVKDSEYDAISWLTQDTKHYYIHRLAISPAFQKQGHARTLMDFAESFAKSNAGVSVRLDTFSQNKRNQRFYENRRLSTPWQHLLSKTKSGPFLLL